MRLLILSLFAFNCVAHAHEIQGTFGADGEKSEIPRTHIPFDTSKKVGNGRVYTLWIAPDGAIVFYLDQPQTPAKFEITKPDPRFRIWLVEAADKEMTLPKGFEDLDSEKKGSVAGAQELTGKAEVVWKNETDYSIHLDMKGKKTLFKGSLFGGGSAAVKDGPASSDAPTHDAADLQKFQGLAAKGEVKAMIELGLMYHTGNGVAQDYGKAMDWYLKAFIKGDGDAYNNIGVMYRDGLGFETNRSIAYALFYITHMRGLGTEATQYRAGSNLDKTAAMMEPKEIANTVKMTERYVLTFVLKRGKLNEKEQMLKFSKEFPAIEKLSKL